MKAYIDYNDATKTHYYKDFEVRESLPKIGDYEDNTRVIKINQLTLDSEQPDLEVYDYSYYEIISKYDDEDDSEDNYYYSYVAIKYEDEN